MGGAVYVASLQNKGLMESPNIFCISVVDPIFGKRNIPLSHKPGMGIVSKLGLHSFEKFSLSYYLFTGYISVYIYIYIFKTYLTLYCNIWSSLLIERFGYYRLITYKINACCQWTSYLL